MPTGGWCRRPSSCIVRGSCPARANFDRVPIKRLRATCAPAKRLNLREHSMRSIEQQMRGQYFAIDLTDMSEWLARKQINPSRFTYSTDQFSASPDRENQVRI